MIITLNNFVINNDSEKIYLDEDLIGLSLSDVRTSSGKFSGRHGGYVGAQYYDIRQISIQGKIFDSDASNLHTKRRALQAALVSGAGGSPNKFPVEMLVQDDATGSYLINAFFTDLQMPIKRAISEAPFKIELIAPDVIIYDNSSPGLTTITLPRQTGGGLAWPLTWPLSWAAGSGATNAINSGSATVYPTITLTGSMTNPIITNLTTGKVFKLDPLVTSVGDVVEIDMRPTNRTVLLNGGNIAAAITTDSSWFGLISGTNTLLLTTSSGSDTVSGTVSWKPGVMGI